MTEQSSRPIRQRTFARQATEPGRVVDGFLWINTAGGANGNNTERYYWNEDTDAWELDSAVGPDTPLHPVSGATWRDTFNASSKQNVDGTDLGWEPMGVTDHGALGGLADDDHTAYATNTDLTNHAGVATAHQDLAWTEDANSPVSVVGVASSSYTLAGTYDEVMIRLHNVTGSATTAQNLHLQINGDTGTNYDTIVSGATTYSAAAQFIMAGTADPSIHTFNGSVIIDGRWSEDASVAGSLGGYSDKLIQGGWNKAAVSPLDSFKLYWGSGNLTADYEVYGRDIA